MALIRHKRTVATQRPCFARRWSPPDLIVGNRIMVLCPKTMEMGRSKSPFSKTPPILQTLPTYLTFFGRTRVSRQPMNQSKRNAATKRRQKSSTHRVCIRYCRHEEGYSETDLGVAQEKVVNFFRCFLPVVLHGPQRTHISIEQESQPATGLGSTLRNSAWSLPDGMERV